MSLLKFQDTAPVIIIFSSLHMTAKVTSLPVQKIRAVYTGIKNLSFSHIPVFLLEVARQLPLNTAKKPEWKTHLWSVVFWNSAGFHCFFANVNARSPLAGIIRVFGHVGRDLPRNHLRPRRTAHYVRSKVERSRACAPLTKKPVWDSGFFAHALSSQKTWKIMGFSGSVHGTTKTPGFCQCKWA